VAITGHARDEDKRRCLAAGFDGYVAKPIDLPEIIDLVAAAPRGSGGAP
jgi:two-component system sensor histidine kinase/response regulator